MIVGLIPSRHNGKILPIFINLRPILLVINQKFMLLKRFEFLLHPTGKIEISRGIRTFFALAIPIAIGYALGQPELGWNIGSSAQLLLLADVGGLYGIRAHWCQLKGMGSQIC